MRHRHGFDIDRNRRYARFDSFEDYLFVALRCPWRDGGRSGDIQGNGRLPEFLAPFREHLPGALPRSCCEPDGPVPGTGRPSVLPWPRSSARQATGAGPGSWRA
jgi:hypothetical protein